MVEIFKTNVERAEDANFLLQTLTLVFPCYKINFDFSDCDKILRIEGENIMLDKIIEILNRNNYVCINLD